MTEAPALPAARMVAVARRPQGVGSGLPEGSAPPPAGHAGPPNAIGKLLAQGNRIEGRIHGFRFGRDTEYFASDVKFALIDMQILAYPATRRTPNTG